MGLQVKICLNKHCEVPKLDFLDTTGIYNIVTNPTGYGAPNPDYTEITSAVISFTPPNTITPIDITLTQPQIAAMVNGEVPIGITPASVNLPAFEDGWGAVQYQISGISNLIPFSYSVTTEFFWDCGVACCVDKIGADAAAQGDPCCDDCDKTKKYQKALLLLDLLHAAICCGNKNAAQIVYNKLKLICDGQDCGCGG